MINVVVQVDQQHHKKQQSSWSRFSKAVCRYLGSDPFVGSADADADASEAFDFDFAQ